MAERLRGKNTVVRVIAGIFVGLLVGLYLAPEVGSAEWSRESTRSYIAIGALLGAMVGVVLSFVGDLRISAYWFWLVVAVGASMVLPVLPSKTGMIPLGAAYTRRHFDGKLVLAHVAVCEILVIVFIQRYSVAQRRKNPEAVKPKVSVSAILTWTAVGVLAIVLPLCLCESVFFSLAIALAIGGRVTCEILAR